MRSPFRKDPPGLYPPIAAAFFVLLASGCLAAAQSRLHDSGPDPLSTGETALAKHDNQSALDFFTRFTAENPNDVRARFLLGGTHLQMGDPKAAAVDFEKAISLDPGFWPAHLNLVVADAMAEDWPRFDRERAVLKAARDANKPGLKKDGHDTIDIFTVKGDTWHAWAFPQLNGNFHTRYLFVHSGADGKPDRWLQCESDDADQMFFQQKHPKEAAAGARSFSLDSYSQGENGMVTQGLVKFYMEGEPSYEKVREDVLGVLKGAAQPSATTTAKPSTQPAGPSPHP